MANIAVTIGDVVAPSGVTAQSGYVAGEAIDAGEVVYLDTASNTLKLADCDSSAATAEVLGIAVTTSATGQPVQWVPTGNSITLSSVLTVGEIYVLSGDAGKIAPEADLASGDYVSILGVATSTTNLKLAINNSGVQVP